MQSIDNHIICFSNGMIVNQKLNFVSEKLYCHIVIPPIITVHSHIASPIMVIPRIASCSALPQFSQTFAYREAYASMFFVTLQSLIRKIVSPNYCNTTNCYVLRTPAILSDIRISRSLRFYVFCNTAEPHSQNRLSQLL